MENFGFVLATRMLVEGRRKVRFMYHEKTSSPQDSGWRFFCGDEDDDYVNEPDNILIKDINELIRIDKSILPYLKSPEGTAWEREDENSVFVASKDFVMDGGSD